MSSARRKPEDSVEGCRALEQADRLRAAAMPNPQMRETLERSAEAWSARAGLLERLDANFPARAAKNAKSRPIPGEEGQSNG